MSEHFQITKTSILSKEIPDQWFALALSGNCQARTFEGHMGPDEGKNLLIIVDNAECVKDDVIETLQWSLCHEYNYLYMNYSGQSKFEMK